MTLAQKVFDMCPDRIRFLLFELDEDEKRFIEIELENRIKISEYLFNKRRTSYENRIKKVIELKQDSVSMKFLLKKYEKGKFHKYFLKRIDDFDYNIKLLLLDNF